MAHGERAAWISNRTKEYWGRLKGNERTVRRRDERDLLAAAQGWSIGHEFGPCNSFQEVQSYCQFVCWCGWPAAAHAGVKRIRAEADVASWVDSWLDLE